ncbi:AzlD domain-containing protein [Parahaliea aestuarii]|uniref:AzlD domain-containing protein n=1 Tax=Parahaliea aestuarii TaxID=1852021 RepID=A0A5C8ZYJ1_9GAMM|nr:AzlD domain-containing protein [Parahaliea aestuarii]TXS93566.1 AzlD domain-containing protein [Parahaliea aestuarii]
MTALLAIVLSGMGTYFSRAVFIIALANRRIPSHLRLAMEYVGPSVMAALVVTMLISPAGDLMLGVAEGLALLTAGLVAWRSRNHLLTIVLAMAVFWGVRALLG